MTCQLTCSGSCVLSRSTGGVQFTFEFIRRALSASIVSTRFCDYTPVQASGNVPLALSTPPHTPEPSPSHPLYCAALQARYPHSPRHLTADQQGLARVRARRRDLLAPVVCRLAVSG